MRCRGEGICTYASTHNFSGLPGFEGFPGRGTRRFLSGKPAHPLYRSHRLRGKHFRRFRRRARQSQHARTLIATDGFDGNSVSCIIDRDSNVVISPTNLDFFSAKLDDLFVANKDPELASPAGEMQANMQANVSG
ncbi:MAG: histidine kinase, partial [Ruthenibacterium lactatiformans]